MGRGRATTQRASATEGNRPRAARSVHRPLVEEPLLGISAEQARRFLQFKRDHFQIEYVTSSQRLRRAKKILERSERHGFDIETAAFRSWGVANGYPRLLQIGIETPETGPYQAVIDTRHVDPRPVFSLLRSREYETIMQNYDFELQWMYFHHGVRIGHPYDTRIASAEIRRAVKERFVLADGSIDGDAPAWVRRMYPDGWVKRDNKLSTICEDTLEFGIPKSGLQDGDWNVEKLPPRLLVYAGGDPAVTLAAADVQVEWARELGITDSLARQFDNGPKVIFKRMTDKAASTFDDSEQMIHAVTRAASAAEVERLAHSARQMAIWYKHRPLVDEAIRTRRAHFAA